MKNTGIVAALSAGLLLVGLVQPGPAQAQAQSQTQSQQAQSQAQSPEGVELDTAESAAAEVLVLHATNDGKGIDPAIGKLPQLEQPPFSSYDSYKLLGRESLALGPSGELTLPDGGKLTLSLQKVVSSEKKGETRYVVDAKVLKKNGDKFVSAEFNTRERVHFFLAGPPYDKGILVLGIRVAPK